MSLDIGAALSRGLDRTVKKNGLILVGVFFLVNVVQSIVSESLLQQFLEDLFDDFRAEASSQEAVDAIEQAEGQIAEAFPLGFLDGVPVGALAGLWLALAVVGIVVNIGAIRTFVSDQTDRLPSEYFTRRLLWTLLNLIVGLVIYGVVVAIGLVFLIIPGIFLAVAFFFYNYEIIVEEKNVIDAFSSSWSLTSGNRLLLFVLGLVLFLLSAVATNVVGFVLPTDTVAGSLLNTLINTSITVFGIAVAAQAYNQLRNDGDDDVPDPTMDQGPGYGQGPQAGQNPGQQGSQYGGQQRGGQQGQDRDDVY